jgi:hypothetical protein
MDLGGFMSNVGKVAHETTNALGSMQHSSNWAGPYVHNSGAQQGSQVHQSSHAAPHRGRRGRHGRKNS